MDDLGFNKIAGAVLATGLGMMLLMKLPGLFIAHADDSFAYTADYTPPDPNADKNTEKAPELPFPQQSWIGAMDAAAGAKVFKKCKSCHNVEAGGSNGTGPALYGVLGNDIATQDGYKYSPALTGLEGNWTYEALDLYLKKPSDYAPGTKMNFPGLKKPAQRAAVIEYLRVADPTPAAKPTAAAVVPVETTEPAVVTEEVPSETLEPAEQVVPEVPVEIETMEPKEPAETPQ